MQGPLARGRAALRRSLSRPGVALVLLIAVLVAGIVGAGGASSLRTADSEIAALIGDTASPREPARPASDRATRALAIPEPIAEPQPTSEPEAEVTETAPSDAAPSDAAPADAAPAEAPPPPTEAPPPADDRIPLIAPASGMQAFAGLSTWIDLYDVAWTPEQQAEVAHRGGVDIIFVQSARYNSPTDIHDAGRLGALIEAAHDRGIQVVTWYIPDFLDEELDLRRSMAAIAFTTPRGDRPDAFGLDIELGALPDVGARNERLLRLSDRLRQWVGPDHPMAAIVLPPLQLDLNGTWWPGFPYAALRPYYDVYIPMSYSSYRGTGPEITFSWNLENTLETRRRAGDPDLPIHMAGGIADNLPEVEAYVDAAREGKVLGAGLYDLHTTRADAWPALQRLRLTPGTAGEVPSLVAPD